MWQHTAITTLFRKYRSFVLRLLPYRVSSNNVNAFFRVYISMYPTTCAMLSSGLLLLFGAFLAFETRKVTVPALNDSKFIGKQNVIRLN